jgi:hypothetical protein
MTLKTALTTDAVSEIELNYTAANKAIVTAMPATGRLIIDSSIGSVDTEEFTYTAKTITATKLAFTVNARAVRSTVEAAHAANSNVRFLPYDFNIIYGNMTVTAKVVDDTRKPIQDLTSRNNSFVYTQFNDEDGLRANIWNPIPATVAKPGYSTSKVFTSTSDEGDTDPATEMGMKALAYQIGGAWKPDTVTLGWLGYFPDLVASVASVSGEQNQTTASRPAVALQAAKTNAAYANLWTVAAQVSSDYGTWTAWTKASTDAVIPAGTKYLRWVQAGTITGVANNAAKVGISAITIGLTNYPNIQIRTETNNYKLDCIIRNETTGEFFRVVYPMLLGETLIIDTDPNFPTAKYKGQIVNSAIYLSSARACTLKLQPGANTIGYETQLAGPSDISIAIKWRDRMNFL